MQSGSQPYSEFPSRAPAEKLTPIGRFNQRALSQIWPPGSLSRRGEEEPIEPPQTSAAMAGDGSDQRALQYEQTLVSWTG